MTESYDVVVVGAGLAGLRAAIAAAEAGARVLVVGKVPPDGTTSAVAWGGASGAVGGASVEDYLALLEQHAHGVGNPALRRVLAQDTAFRLEELERFGVPIIAGRGHVRVEGPFSRPATSMVRPMLDFARSVGVETAYGFCVTGLLLAEGGAAGVIVGGQRRRREIRAGGVVLAGGGFAGLLPRNDNQGRNLGDCIALALLGGARVVDMEFIVFQPPGLAEPGLRMDSVYARPIVTAGRWLTLDGQPLDPRSADEYFRRQARKLSRDDERFDLLCDLSRLTAQDWEEEPLGQALAEFLRGRVPDGPLRIAPLAHYTLGGVAIDEDGFTGVPGLYAAGECTGGVFGAGRPGGGALADCIVFGARAGAAAAKAAEACREGEATVLELRAAPVEEAEKLAREAGWALWNYGGLYKHEEGLRAGLAWLEGVAARLADAPAPSDDEGASAEASAAVLVARAAMLAALKRAETRGAHRRLDHPQPAPAFEGASFAFALDELDPGRVALARR